MMQGSLVRPGGRGASERHHVCARSSQSISAVSTGSDRPPRTAGSIDDCRALCKAKAPPVTIRRSGRVVRPSGAFRAAGWATAARPLAPFIDGLDTIVGCTALAQPAGDLRQEPRQLFGECVRRVCNNEPATVEALGSDGAAQHELDGEQLGPADGLQSGAKAGNGLRVLDRIPGEVDAGLEAAQGPAPGPAPAGRARPPPRRADRSGRRRAAPWAAAAT